ncbi:alpha/beta hydrolase family protein [Streptomyces cinnamoneus]|uniref:alpha/beta hydrolase family protein n=1 Tax=Streptomyces cinnamoneus TaxID=53446 RepID=UPI0037B3ABA2
MNLIDVRRRRTVGAVGAALLVLLGGAPAAQAATVTSKPAVGMTLPAPTGPYRTGTTSLHLVDRARTDAWDPARSSRELMVTLRYPARPRHGLPTAPQLPPGTAAQWDLAARDPEAFAIPAGTADWAGTRTHAVAGAAVRRQGGGMPVVLYSPGRNMPRGFGTAVAEDLASRGYLVVALDHTHEAIAVEFPGGRVEKVRQETEESTLRGLVDVRVADTRFVLDQLAVLNAGGNPDAEKRRLPEGLAGGIDLSSVGMFGHSLGGATAAQAMHDDPRIDAAADLDGGVTAGGVDSVGSVVEEGLDRPFLLMNSAMGNHHHASLDPLWQRLRGWHRNLQMTTAGHYSYTDLQAQLPQIDAVHPLPEGRLAQAVGTVPPGRSFQAQRAYVAAFFDLQLRHRDDGLLDGPSRAYPEMRFVD